MVRAGGRVALRDRHVLGHGSVRNLCRQARDFEPWLKDTEINLDGNLRLQYLAGHRLGLYRADVIFSDMRNCAKKSDEIVFGSDDRMQALLQKIRLNLDR